MCFALDLREAYPRRHIGAAAEIDLRRGDCVTVTDNHAHGDVGEIAMLLTPSTPTLEADNISLKSCLPRPNIG